MAFVEL